MATYFTLPSGKTQFCDANGVPIRAGFVYHYIPGTSALKTTWSDYLGSAANPNPIVLDSAGEAIIFGDGAYRQLVKDAAGNTLWDRVTQVPSLSILGAVDKTGDTMTGRLTVPTITTSSTGQSAVTISPIGNPALLSFNPISGATSSSSQNEILSTINFLSSDGAGASSALSKNKVALYSAIQANVGSGNVWAFNPLLYITAGALANGGGQVAEFDLANNSGTDFGDSGGAPAQPAVFGMQVTGISANRATAAIWVAGNLQDLVSPMWNQGLVFSNASVRLTTIADYTNSQTSIDIRGTHSKYAIDLNNGVFTTGAVRLGNQQTILYRNAANSLDLVLAQSSVANSVVLGNSTAPYVLITAANGLAPTADNTMLCGQSGARWSAVWAANGTIQTSDPTLKTDIVPLSSMPATDIVRAIDPIAFRWKDGGGGKPGKRQHWGWDADQIGQVFAAIGQDFGGYVIAEDGTRHLRPDQLLPVLWQAVKDLSARVQTLEGA